jgi:hypothetical protein
MMSVNTTSMVPLKNSKLLKDMGILSQQRLFPQQSAKQAALFFDGIFDGNLLAPTPI